MKKLRREDSGLVEGNLSNTPSHRVRLIVLVIVLLSALAVGVASAQSEWGNYIPAFDSKYPDGEVTYGDED